MKLNSMVDESSKPEIRATLIMRATANKMKEFVLSIFFKI